MVSTLIKWTSPFPFEGLSFGTFHFLLKLSSNIMYANSADHNHTTHSAASDMGLHCLYVSPKRMLG